MARDNPRLPVDNNYVALAIGCLAYLALLVVLYLVFPAAILICIGIGVVIAALGTFRRHKPTTRQRTKPV